jgi:hypothetical protein
MTENELSRLIIDAAIAVHRELGGPGLIEDTSFFNAKTQRLKDASGPAETA